MSESHTEREGRGGAPRAAEGEEGEGEEKTPTRLILWKPYMFSCRTKLENCADAEMTVRSGAQREETETLHVVVLEVGAEYGSAELAHIGHDKADAQKSRFGIDSRLSSGNTDTLFRALSK